MTTYFANKREFKEKKWQVIDARGQVVGRLAARISRILTGKNEVNYTPHVETGEGVVVVNASQVMLSGNKAKTKSYKFYSGYPSGLREKSFEKVMNEDPAYVIQHAVRGMLPKSRLGKRMITRLRVYAGAEHPHAAQMTRKSESAPVSKAKK